MTGPSAMLGLLIGPRNSPRLLAFLTLCGLVLFFLVAPILAIAPLSFNKEPYFTYPIRSYSLRWYEAFFLTANWQLALRNSIIVASATAALATLLGTLAALGLARPEFRFRGAVTALLLSPMVLPIIVTAVAIYLFYARIGLNGSFTGLVLAHTILASPFVVVTVGATLATYDRTLSRAAASLGAGPVRAFFRVMLPLILPGIASGALFAFITSFDDVVVALFVAGTEQRTLPRQMWSGVRENLDPTITAVATMLVVLSILVVTAGERLRRRLVQRRSSGQIAVSA
jgi:putative spermidine/putrescine transport system permease protein